MLGLHIACGLPLVALAVWFGAIDRLPFGERRCASCGVEGYVIAAHIAAAAWLAAVVAGVAAVRRRLTDGIAAPGRVTVGALAAVSIFVLASLIWRGLFTVPALVTMVASVVLLPVAGIWWVLDAVRWWLRSPVSEAGLRRRVSGTLAAAWVSLTVLLPAVFAWVWADRVSWIVF
jgi:hypothetical protein